MSDCAILFARDYCNDVIEKLRKILTVIREINKKLLEKAISLKTSIAYGPFKYEDRIVFEGIQKGLFYGKAYLKAYFDNENGQPKMEPGQCRIVKNGLPEEIDQYLRNVPNTNDEIFQLLESKNGHFYFYWMLDNGKEIEKFKEIY